MLAFWRYLKDLTRSGWGTFFVLAGAVSTAMTFVAPYFPGFILPRWSLIAVSVVAWVIAPFRLYQSLIMRLDATESQRVPARRSALVLIEESGSYYILEFDQQKRVETGATYLELHVSLENKGDRNSTVNRYDLQVDGQRFDGVRPSPRGVVYGRSMYPLNPQCMVNSYIEAPAERLVPHLLIPFYVQWRPAAGAGALRVSLTVYDTEGNSATVEVSASQRP